jgi:hypothetical protein
VRPAPEEVGGVVAHHAAERAGEEHHPEAVVAERQPVRQHPGQKQRDVALDHRQEEDGPRPVPPHQLVEELRIHSRTVSSEQ